MNVYHDKRFESEPSGYHPYTGGTYSNEVHYYDFKKNPDLIPNVLEDFVGWNNQPAIQQFYSILRWLNGPESLLESNDCAFMGPHEETDPKRPKKIVVSGRLMIFYRDISLNFSRDNVEMMRTAVQHFLGQLAPELDLEQASVGVSTCSVVYSHFNRGGCRLMISFWAWGNDDQEAFDNLYRLFKALSECLTIVSGEIKKAASERF